jgi:hypothetical protein
MSFAEAVSAQTKEAVLEIDSSPIPDDIGRHFSRSREIVAHANQLQTKGPGEDG